VRRAEREREAQRAAAKAAAELEAEAAAAHMERGGGASTSPADSATDSYWTYGSSLPSNPSVRWAVLSNPDIPRLQVLEYKMTCQA
jgi:hypothetical protein